MKTLKKCKVLLLDDEAYILDMLENMIQWQFYGFEIVGTAKNAKDAMQIYYDHHPDIIITDICMDDITGIEFVTKIRLQDEHIKVIILSAYDKFEYAQSALKLKVDGYLLKPVNKNELLNQLLDMQKKLNDETEYEGKIKCLQESLDELEQKYWRNELLDLYVEHKNKLSEKTSDNQKYWQVMSVRPIVRNEIVFVERDLKQIPHINTDIVFAADGLFAVFLRAEDEKDLKRANEFIKHKYCQNNGTLLCGVSDIEKGEECLSDLCRQSKMALNWLFYEDFRILFFKYKKVEPWTTGFAGFDKEQIGYFLINHESENCKEMLRQYLQQWKRHNASCEEVISQCIEVKELAVQLTAEKKLIDELDRLQASMETVYSCGRLKSLVFRCIELADSDGLKSKKVQRLIINAQSYMKEHCCEESFSVDSLADHLRISKSYLSKVYKEETKESVWSYVIRFRMSKAKELLVNSEATGYAIARQIGYTSEYHFSRAFTKAVGMSPSVYKKLYMKIR